MGAALLFLLAVVFSGESLPVCDLVEINHCTEDDGTETFCQMLAWDWSPQHRRFDCQQWVMVNSFCRLDGVTHGNTDQGRSVVIRSKLFRETWTRHDPERENLKLFGIQFRRKVF